MSNIKFPFANLTPEKKNQDMFQQKDEGYNLSITYEFCVNRLWCYMNIYGKVDSLALYKIYAEMGLEQEDIIFRICQWYCNDISPVWVVVPSEVANDTSCENCEIFTTASLSIDFNSEELHILKDMCLLEWF